ncbi:hypothetical protein U0070_012133 [Myodes glareolus]|uniref:BOD1/SHG1 domain-containing protein n=1 Tax=Myodes glareolus TaxID=447135 RepID=A0AAW0K291_MYOGA
MGPSTSHPTASVAATSMGSSMSAQRAHGCRRSNRVLASARAWGAAMVDGTGAGAAGQASGPAAVRVGQGACFHPDYLADVDTKPAYQNLRQKVDNFVSTHLNKQEWNPAMNKNQLRNGLRQSMVQSGMLEAGVDRIISQVVDPKLNHIFRSQIEQAVHEVLAAQKKEAVPAPPPEPESQDPPAPSQDTS